MNREERERERLRRMNERERERDREREKAMCTLLIPNAALVIPLPRLHRSIPLTSRHTRMRPLGIGLGH